ncbi:MAG TPA: M15 family metallopeptidase, partial [Actinomycetota bacterium]|nr:M15 family metallopeptidase [Actinomycetota bacterium]
RPERSPAASPGDAAVVAAAAPRRPRALVAWAPGGLPPGAEAAARRAPGVGIVTTVYAGLDWIRAVRLRSGTPVQVLQDGWRIPFEVAVVEPRALARLAPQRDRAALGALGPGRVVLARDAARLRRVRRGARIALHGRTVRVAGVVSNHTALGYEAVAAGPVPSSWPRADRFVVARARPRGVDALARRLRPLLAPGQRLRVRSEGETPFLRYGDAVQPQLVLKREFGEFRARPAGSGHVDVDARWRERNVVTRAVPILGRVTCHRRVLPQMRAALHELAERGLGHLLDASQYGGCFVARFIDSNPDGRLSHHSWGIAFDVETSDNRFGAEPQLDARVVDVMERWGFTWGGRWAFPDGMHFEWVRFP